MSCDEYLVPKSQTTQTVAPELQEKLNNVAAEFKDFWANIPIREINPAQYYNVVPGGFCGDTPVVELITPEMAKLLTKSNEQLKNLPVTFEFPDSEEERIWRATQLAARE